MDCIFCTDEILPGSIDYYMPQHKLATVCHNHYHLSCWDTYPNKNICPMCNEELISNIIHDLFEISDKSVTKTKYRKKFEYKVLAFIPVVAYMLYRTVSKQNKI